MISLTEFKEKIKILEEELEKNNINPDEIFLCYDYLDFFSSVDFVFWNDGYYGTFIRIDFKF
jgi:hypothetical protein